MEKIIVYLDDPAFALHHLMPMRNASAAGVRQASHWVLVACPPRLTRHAGKWLTRSALHNWRVKWSEALFAGITPALQAQGDHVTLVVANGSLIELTRELQFKHGMARVLDARRPKFGQDMLPVAPDQPVSHQARWAVPGAVAGMGAALLLAAE
jgi:hypothetical protein